MSWNGKASTYFVKWSVTAKMCSFSLLVTGNVTMKSRDIFSKGHKEVISIKRTPTSTNKFCCWQTLHSWTQEALLLRYPGQCTLSWILVLVFFIPNWQELLCNWWNGICRTELGSTNCSTLGPVEDSLTLLNSTTSQITSLFCDAKMGEDPCLLHATPFLC